MKIWIGGYCKSSKSTHADALGEKLKLEVINCDKFIAPGNWDKMPHIIIEHIKNKDNYILEGIVLSRVIRKLHELDLDIRPDEYYYLNDVKTDITKAQASLNKGISTIHKDCIPILREWGIEILSETDLDNK